MKISFLCATTLAIFITTICSDPVIAQRGKGKNNQDPPPPPPEEHSLQSLGQVPVPRPSNLEDFISNEAAAIQLGKALFWDMQVGSDNFTACATCHFHAGADNRAKNQISPGLLMVDQDGVASPDETFQVGGPNYTLQASDFPLRKLKNVNKAGSKVLRDSNDVVSSQGVFLRDFIDLDENNQEITQAVFDTTFCVGNCSTRRVEPRNSPSVINAIFNHRNFWDGRAQDMFNGVNPFGLRDPAAKVYFAANKSKIEAVSVAIDNASLASQAVGPPLSAFEMSAGGKLFPELARRLLSQRPLALQKVHPDDSVLGSLSRADEAGLITPDYATLIRQAFRKQWWQYTNNIGIDALDYDHGGTAHADSSAALAAAIKGHGNPHANPDGYSQMEVNFSLFFGLALQCYQATLVSDDTPFDHYAEGDESALTALQKDGLEIFNGKAKCASCHKNGEFTGASVQNVLHERLESMIMGDGELAIYDNGFYNIGVRPTLEDLGVGGLDPFGLPLSESRLLVLFGPQTFEQVLGASPNLSASPGDRVAADGAFKTPGLRNIELTAPYMHNGGQGTLLQVVEFYNRGGDFAHENIDHLDADIEPLGLSNSEKLALVEFMLSLTDERVRHRRAPFDHPQLFIPNGHIGDTSSVLDNGDFEAMDQVMELPATGRSGGTPLPNFLK